MKKKVAVFDLLIAFDERRSRARGCVTRGKLFVCVRRIIDRSHYRAVRLKTNQSFKCSRTANSIRDPDDGEDTHAKT